jgi:hypothetical protein
MMSRCMVIAHLLLDAAEVYGQAVLVMLHLCTGDGLHLGRQCAVHLRERWGHMHVGHQVYFGWKLHKDLVVTHHEGIRI